MIDELFLPEAWYATLIQLTGIKSRLFQSGAVYRSAEIDAQITGAGTTWDVPFVNDLTGEDQVIVDDKSAPLTASGLTGGQATGTKLYRGNKWSTADIAAWATGIDPAMTIVERIGAWWDRKFQRHMIRVLDGCFGSYGTTPPTNADFYNDQQLLIYATNGGSDIAHQLTGDTFIDALTLAGDDLDATALAIMHSDTLRSLEKQDLIEFIKPSEDVTIRVYQGHEVITDDGMPKYVAGQTPPGYTSPLPSNANNMYATYVLGANSIAFGEGSIKDTEAFATQRDEDNSITNIYSRRSFGIQPFGANWTNTVKSQKTPTNANLSNNLNWTRAWDQSSVNIYRIVHNVAGK